jgi:SAM-dependent methyltransferase
MPPNAYDEVLYEGHPFDQTHPDRLATVARVFGAAPAAPSDCRLLEIGCGDGGNLVPMAYTLPGSRFVGIDAGARGIEKGLQLARDAGVDNVELLHLDILAAGSELGAFDYIVAHGVYSWTPPAVQQKILALCGELLRPHGVAYISYSVYPGAHIRQMVAEMLRYRTARFDDPMEKIEQARGMLGFLAGGSALLRQEVERLAQRRPATLFHDELSPHHHPLYFQEFVERAAGHNLQYLGEAEFAQMQETGLSAETVGVLRQIAPSLIEREQHLDFLRCRRFRQTLLCRSQVTLDRRIRSAQMREFFVRGARDEALPPITNHPTAEAAAAALNDAWPGALSVAELLASTREEDEEVLADLILAHYACGRFELRTEAPRFARTVSERPRASAVARAQARTGEYVTNLCHTPVRLEDEWSRTLLLALDGTRDRAELDRGGLETLARLALLEA